ncbi:Penicillinase repressor [Botrimarina colliarenosi]|uniref:Penicillinase repressor n=1 Tax=Botrimarina colliarenosi TaxID=2528001 RepID=A0A5C6AI59_9BACT|nr:BlaI/MecI/CopY family transcriptional regulator [Botrimarina colliarenosi]TWT99684.1 Penicillinase repressor [Botrimarina colliarenosi]
MPAKPNTPLSDLENKVMEVVWGAGQVTADAVRVALEAWRPLKDSTIRTVLRRLAEKGYVRHVTEGRTYVYSPTQPAPTVAADAVRGIIDKLCNGSIEALLVGMVDQEVVSPEKLEQLAKRIAAKRKSSNQRRTRRNQGD